MAFDMTLGMATSAPRIHHQWMPDMAGGARHFARYGVDSRGEQTQDPVSNSTIGRVNRYRLRMAGFTARRPKTTGRPRQSGNSAHRSHFSCRRPTATRSPFASQISQSCSVTPFIRVCDLAPQTSVLAYHATALSSLRSVTQPTLGTSVKDGGGIMSPNIKRSIGWMSAPSTYCM